MPRLKNRGRREAGKRRMARLKLLGLTSRPSSSFVAHKGTGYRHPVARWPLSLLNHRTHKLVVPADSPDKKFILVVGDCNLRGIVDGHIQMPEGGLSFGFLSISKASAADLRTHVLSAVLPRTPDAVCLLAPSISLSRTMQIRNLGVEFGRLLISVCSCWPKVFVLDFPPSLQIKVSQQELLRQEFRQVATQMGIRYLPIAEHFPLDRFELWSRDGVHLSDSDGMPILAQLLWDAAYIQVESPGPETTRPADLDESCVAVKKRVDQQEEDIVLKDCSVVIKRVRFNYELQDYLHNDIYDIYAPASTAGPKGPRRSARLHSQSLVASKKRAIAFQQQAEATAPVASPISAHASVSAVAVKEEIATLSSDQPLEHTLKECASDLWRLDLIEQQPISDEEELEAGPVDDTDVSAVGDHTVHVFNFAIEDMEWQVKIEEETEDKLRVTPTMQEDFFSSDRQQLPDEVKNFQEKLSVTERDNTGLKADLQTMKDQLEQRDQEIFSLQNKLSSLDKHYKANVAARRNLNHEHAKAKEDIRRKGEEIISLQREIGRMRASAEQLNDSKHFKTMEEKWQKEISQLKELLSKREKQISREKDKRQARSKAHVATLIQLADVKSALERSKLTCKSLEEQLMKKLAEKEESHQKELKEKEESLRQRFTEAVNTSRRELSNLSESWESKAQEWHKKKAELEEMMLLKEKIWKDEEANLKQSIEHLTKQNTRLQKLVNEKKEQWSL